MRVVFVLLDPVMFACVLFVCCRGAGVYCCVCVVCLPAAVVASWLLVCACIVCIVLRVLI